MKNLFLVIFLFVCIGCNLQRKRAIVGETLYQQELNASYKDASKSPLKKKDLRKFKGIDFFPIDTTFIVLATLTKTKNPKIFEMPTTTDRKPLYKEYGILNFVLKGENCQLTVYQSQDDTRDEHYKEYLFLPFTDGTSGVDSYGGGRYMDLKTTDENTDGTILLNFNNTYNPYCAYNEKYSCPLTPLENHLKIAVKAGVKIFEKH